MKEITSVTNEAWKVTAETLGPLLRGPTWRAELLSAQTAGPQRQLWDTQPCHADKDVPRMPQFTDLSDGSEYGATLTQLWQELN